jgi:hypothetical protein
MFITADQVLAHMVGDYLLQSDWMAQEKVKKSMAAWAHGVTYGLPFIFFEPAWYTFFIIVICHWIIDHFRLARYVVWAKNFLSPKKTYEEFDGKYRERTWWAPWEDCKGTGYHKDRPPFMAVWLMIIADNIMHVTCNGLAFYLQFRLSSM